MKKALIATLVVLGIAGNVFAGTNEALSALNDELRTENSDWSEVWHDYSTYPGSAIGERGTIVRMFDFGVNPPASANSTQSLENAQNGWTNINNGTIIIGGHIQVLTAVTPATATNGVMLNSSGDILAVGTTLNSTGIKALTLNGNASYNITNNLISTNMPLSVEWTGSIPTAGIFRVVLDVFKGHRN